MTRAGGRKGGAQWSVDWTEYDFKHKFNITRNKYFEVFLERRTIIIRVFYSLGFLRGFACLGRINLKLDGLLKHCEVGHNAEVRVP